MSGKPEDASLIALGAALSDGVPIDWDAIESQSTDPNRQLLLHQLRQVAAVISAHRQHHGEDDDTASAPPPDSVIVRHWRHLVLFESIGSGAFGTVYRGWDPRVDREVAVKLLPSGSAASDTSPLEEARNLALVRHPNVVVVYGADLCDGQAGIWMEHIEGQTLAEIVRERGPMSAREVTGIGLELCRALSALHASALLHRDVKAENVMREVGGRIVLMDFSGAEVLQPNDGSSFSGTPLYMAPELFDGAPATFASDVYSLGVLLFFLLSGGVPVTGTTFAELKRAHQRGARKRLRDLRPDVTDAVVQVIERATAANPAERYQTAGELEHALAAASGTPAALGAAGGPAPVPSRFAAVTSAGKRWSIMAGGLLLALSLGLTADHWRSASLVPLVARFEIGPPYVSGSWPRISPDGRFVVYGVWAEGRNRFWIRPLDSVDGRLLMNTTATETPFWSPDSRTLGFFHDGKLRKISAEGGDSDVIADAPFPRGGDWSEKGIIFARVGGIYAVAPDGSNLSQITEIDASRGEFQHAWPEFLPDGDRFLFLVQSSQPEHAGLYLGSLGSRTKRRIMPAFSRAAYASGHLLFVRDGTLVAQPFDAERGTLHGEPDALSGRVKHHAGSDAAFDVSSTGVLIYGTEPGQMKTRLVLTDRRGREVQELTPKGTYRQPRFSPDGQRIVAERTDESGNTDLWVYDIARHSSSRLTRAEAPDVKPVWSPDGREIVFSSRRGAHFDIFKKILDRTDDERLIVAAPQDQLVESWSPDGKYLSSTFARSGLWIVPLVGGQKPWRVRNDDRTAAWQSHFSPDGRWLAYTSAESGAPEVYVEPFPATGARWQISTNGGSEPHWTGDASELFFVNARSELMFVEVPEAGWPASRPQRLFDLPVPELIGPGRYAVSPDGKLFAINAFISDPLVPPVQVVLNWTAQLTR